MSLRNRESLLILIDILLDEFEAALNPRLFKFECIAQMNVFYNL
jgi:hypothetical protein